LLAGLLLGGMVWLPGVQYRERCGCGFPAWDD
jgi:hypothetical protein